MLKAKSLTAHYSRSKTGHLFVFSSPEPRVHSPSSGNGFDIESDVYKMLQDPEEPVSAPKQSGSFRYLQGILEAEDGGN